MALYAELLFPPITSLRILFLYFKASCFSLSHNLFSNCIYLLLLLPYSRYACWRLCFNFFSSSVKYGLSSGPANTSFNGKPLSTNWDEMVTKCQPFVLNPLSSQDLSNLGPAMQNQNLFSLTFSPFLGKHSTPLWSESLPSLPRSTCMGGRITGCCIMSWLSVKMTSRLGKNKLYELRGVQLVKDFPPDLSNFLPNLETWTCKLEITSKISSS